MKEIGGCLPLESLPLINDPFAGVPKLELNSGRSCIYAALNQCQRKKIVIPYYLCPTVKQFLIERGISVREYNVDERLLPLRPELQTDEMLLWVNYYGCMKQKLVDQMVAEYGDQLVVDNTQAFFALPRLQAWSIYACRKFIGVPEGAYLVHEGLVQEKWAGEQSNWEYLQKASNHSSNEAYKDYLAAEGQFIIESRKMSLLTRYYLNAVDYEKIQTSRIQNFRTLHKLLEEYNEFSSEILDFSSETPYMYPFLNRNNSKIREKLLKQKVYTPTWWKHMLTSFGASSREKYLAQNLIPIPVDQRYDVHTMKELGKFLIESVKIK